jgi:hypothetical protein
MIEKRSFIIKSLVTFFAVLSGVSPFAACASQQTGQVKQVALFSDATPNGVFMTNGSRTAKPACATDDLWVVPSPTTDNAKALISGLLSAYLSGKTVYVVGTGSCDVNQTNREDIAYILLQ